MTEHGNRELDALIRLLDDPDIQIFDTVSNRLIELGEEVVPPLERRWEITLKPELQGKIENVIKEIQFNTLRRGMESWKSTGGTDLLYGAFLVARFQYPDLEFEPLNKVIEKSKGKDKEAAKIALKLVDLTYQLKSTAFKDNIMKEAKELFYDKDFVNKLDTNLDIIGFENGIYDLKNGEFRDGRPEDYVSLSSLIDYVPIDECDPKIVKEIQTFMGQVFVNTDVKMYMWS